MSPTYLRTPMREYLVQNDKGVYWLRAPRDAGKTQLARGVIERRPSPKDPATMEGIDSNLATTCARSAPTSARTIRPDRANSSTS
jgi:hypothetical protein